jgi:hypothetical protein
MSLETQTGLAAPTVANPTGQIISDFKLETIPSPKGLDLYITFLRSANDCQRKNVPWIVRLKPSDAYAELFQPTCKNWNCPACGEANRKRWVARALHGIGYFEFLSIPIWFATITSHEKLSANASFRILPRAWDKLNQRYIRKVPGRERAYLAVPERHKSGKLHAHLIMTGEITKKWLKDNARSCGLGYQCDLSEVNSLGVGGYVSKYLVKTLDDNWPKNARRINTSRSWPDLPDLREDDGDTVTFKVPLNMSLEAVQRVLRNLGYQVVISH